MLTQDFDALKANIIRRFKPYFLQNQHLIGTYTFSFEEGVDTFFAFIKHPSPEEELAALDLTLLQSFYKYYVAPKTYQEELVLIKDIATSLDPMLKKILYYVDNSTYNSLTAKRKGLKDVILALPKLIKDYRQKPEQILYDSLNILPTDKGMPYDIQRAYETRNLIHESRELDSALLSQMFKSCTAIYLYSFFEYADIIASKIALPKSDSKIIQSEKEKQSKFNRYIDGWSHFVNSSLIIVDKKEIKGVNISKILCEEIFKELQKEMIGFGREVLRKNYKEIDLFKFFYEMGYPINSIDEMSKKFIAKMEHMDMNSRWEYIKIFVGSVGSETEKTKNYLSGLGSINFYRIDFYEGVELSRQYFYDVVMQKINDKYGVFTDGFLTKIEQIVNFIDGTECPSDYIEEFNSGFNSKFDYLLLLYLLFPGRKPPKMVQNIKKYVYFEKIINLETTKFMLDSPYLDDFKGDIENILSGTN